MVAAIGGVAGTECTSCSMGGACFEADIEQFDALEIQEDSGISCKTTLDGSSSHRDAIKIIRRVLHGIARFSTSPTRTQGIRRENKLASNNKPTNGHSGIC